jgi:hypothetical protein
MIDELEMIWMEEVVTYSMCYAEIFLKYMRKIMKILGYAMTRPSFELNTSRI